ncbi:hypothetical protein BX666DRAFT_1884078 [Dichotomocladium elegans]|nr:hypothetical protein BX666DRAFT_1884078 [Dichotomocladium elegans]
MHRSRDVPCTPRAGRIIRVNFFFLMFDQQKGRSSGAFLIAISIVLITLGVSFFSNNARSSDNHATLHQYGNVSAAAPTSAPATAPAPVPVELFVMSKCPDKGVCEEVFDQVLREVKVPVSLSVNYIAKANPAEALQYECMHGESECIGNIQELCYRQVYPDYRDWFGFALCLNDRLREIGIDPELPYQCATKLGQSYAPVDACVKSNLGIELLGKSVERTQSLGVRKSCTIYIDNKQRCIRDGGWKECDEGHEVADFVRMIEESYHN